MKELLAAEPSRWTNGCEGMFTSFRTATIHLKNEKQAIDDCEDKETITAFIVRFCKTRPPFKTRSEEVLKILLGSDAFKEAFRKTEVDALPPKAQELVGVEPPADVAEEAPPESSGSTSVVIVVERCSEVRLRTDVDADGWDSIEQGLVIRVSLAAGACPRLVASVARSLLSAKLSAASGGAGGEPAESVAELCRQGKPQGIVVVPQTLLIAQLGADDGKLSYPSLDVEDNRGQLYGALVQALRDEAGALPEGGPKVVAGRYGDPQSWEIKSDGFMHSFRF